MTAKNTDSGTEQSRVLELLERMLALHETKVDCTTCGETMDCLADLVTAGQDPNKALPAINLHLMCCEHCYEEFEALLLVLNAQQEGKL